MGLTRKPYPRLDAEMRKRIAKHKSEDYLSEMLNLGKYNMHREDDDTVEAVHNRFKKNLVLKFRVDPGKTRIRLTFKEIRNRET